VPATPNYPPTGSIARYDIARTQEGWTIFRNGSAETSLETKRAAFEEVVEAVLAQILEGQGIVITVASDAEDSKSQEL